MNNNHNKNRRFIAVFPDSKEYVFESTIDQVTQMVERIVYESKIRTERSNPQKIKIKVDEVQVVNYQDHRVSYKIIEVMPTLTRMTQEEFDKEQNDLLSDIPEEFQSALRQNAWDRGHSAGLEEVICCLSNDINTFEPAIKAFEKRLKAK